jgi:hypothetical protein
MKIIPHGLLFASVTTLGCIGALPTSTGTGGQGGAAGAGGAPPGGLLISPDRNGAFDGSNAAGVVGAWWSTGDDYASPGMGNVAGAGDCPRAGFAQSQCSAIMSPDPLAPTFAPDPGGRGMCTSGVSAMVLPDSTGQPAWSAIWGNIIGFTLNTPAVDANGNVPHAPTGQYDAVARGITGFAFDLDGSVSAVRVAFQTQGTENSPAYWGGAFMDVSPVAGPGHYAIHWADVGGPAYVTAPAPFDPSKLEAIQFHVPATAFEARPYSYCIRNTTLLTD